MEIIGKDQNPQYTQKLRNLLESTKKWGKEITGYDYDVAVDNFMFEIGNLYLDYFQYHIEEAKVLAFEFEDILPQIFEKMTKKYVRGKEFDLYRIDPEESSWMFVCFEKTRIEAFNSLFSHITGKLTSEKFDKFLEISKENPDLFPEDIPDNAPDEHWWWYANPTSD